MMSLTQSGETDSSNTICNLTNPNLSSNNPFRNRAASPLSPNFPIARSPSDPSIRPASRNPFLDAAVNSSTASSAHSNMPSLPQKLQSPSPVSGDFANIFDSLSVNDKSTASKKSTKPAEKSPASKPPPSHDSRRRENLPPRVPSGHKLTKSQEEALRARKSTGGSPSSKPRPTDDLDIFADPPNASRKPSERRTRRNSDTSTNGSPIKPANLEDEKRRQERRRRDRKLRERDEKDPKSKKSNHKLDVIDKLDVTSIYGTGLFHHDGPFDACNPHRNRHGSKRAPMKAFPKDSLNNVLGGGGPLNKRPDHATFLGNNHEEAFKDYSKGGGNYNDFEPYNNGTLTAGHLRQESNVVSATSRVEPIHGEETLGLGTSTFLEGAPASKTAIQRRKSESPSPDNNLSRSKSLAQKFRGINVPRRDYVPWITSPDTTSPESRVFGAAKGERRSNTDFEDTVKGDDGIAKKRDSSAVIGSAEKASSRGRENSIPRFRNSLDRHPTSEANGDMISGKPSSGFLNRVKSLKGGSRKMKTNPIES